MFEINIVEIIITMFGTIMASSGFWYWLLRREDRKDTKTKLLMGLASYRIATSGMFYIERGWISKDEYELMNDMLYLPYKNLGGNGLAAKVMCNLEKLPLIEDKKTMHKECKTDDL